MATLLTSSCFCTLRDLRVVRVRCVPRVLCVLRALCALCVKFLSFPARITILLLLAFFLANSASTQQEATPRSYLGFDRNIYPGDDALPILRKTFSFASYWLSPPPGERTNTWSGKRALLRSQGFGFLVLYRGPESRELEKVKDTRQKGEDDSIAAADAAEREGFPPMTIIFLDIEEGGRLSPAYHAYIHGWLWYLRSAQGRNY